MADHTHRVSTTIEPKRVLVVSDAEYENLRGLGILTKESLDGGLDEKAAQAEESGTPEKKTTEKKEAAK